MDWRVQKVLSLIEAQECRDDKRSMLTEAGIAVRLSNSRLRHIFKAERGIAPGQFIKSLRLQRARELLESSILTVKEVMTEAGFNDKSYFTRAFKQCFGVSPSAYRSQFVGKTIRKADLPELRLLHAVGRKTLSEAPSRIANLSNK